MNAEGAPRVRDRERRQSPNGRLDAGTVQLDLFVLADTRAPGPEALSSSGIPDEHGPDLTPLLRRVRAVSDSVERARVASQLRDQAEMMVSAAVRKAVEEGLSWRDIGARLGIPFQTLYGRYGPSR